MALVSATLKPFREPYPGSGEAFAARLAQDYDDYAQNATAADAAPQFTGSERGRFEALLIPVFKTWNPDRTRFAQALADAVAAYWTGMPFQGTGVGALTAITPHAIIVPAITAFQNGMTLEEANQRIAEALDGGTKTGLITLTYPGAPPVVVPNIPLT